MRGLAFLLPIAFAGCAGPTANAPSLAPRAAEAIDPRVPVPEMIVSPDVSIALLEQIRRLVEQAQAGDQAFQAAAATAERLAASAGAPQSESWIAAQQALSVAVAARGPVARAVSEIDALGATRIQQQGGLNPADLAAIKEAAARVAEIDTREAEVVARIQARLGG